jgi:hypothetical protein
MLDTTTFGPSTNPRALVQTSYKAYVIWVYTSAKPMQLGLGTPFQSQVSWVRKGMRDPS